jgi:hypothetical protein
VRTPRNPPSHWQCDHTYPIEVQEVTGGGEIARCLGCGARGPVRGSAQEAVETLRAEAQYLLKRRGA